jgi:hypothetical protein
VQAGEREDCLHIVKIEGRGGEGGILYLCVGSIVKGYIERNPGSLQLYPR